VSTLRPFVRFGALAILVVACGPVVTSPAPGSSWLPSSGAPSPAVAASGSVDVPSADTTPPTPGLGWIKAANVGRPDDAFADASAGPTTPSGPGTAGHPGHFAGQAIVDDVATANGRFVAVGYVGLRGVWTAIAWTSIDEETWELATIDDQPGSFAVSIVVTADGQFVAGGRSGPTPVVWTSADGRDWTRLELPTLSRGAEWERVATVLVTTHGLIAGGSAGPELGDRRARLWRSADGRDWQPVADAPSFEGGEVVTILARGTTYVALGRLGTGQRATGSVAWTSADGATWDRIESASLAGGLVAALAETPDGRLVAVGSDLDEREALVWRSSDARAWELAPHEESRLYNGDKIRMTDVTAIGGALVAVGNFVGVQYGTATSWTSTDGVTWRRAPRNPALEQGEMLAVTVGRSDLLAVGSFGAPDNYIPTIWRSGLPPGG
jgi:hypothetical protein